MVSRSAIRSKLLVIAALGLATPLLSAATAAAVFPPIYQQSAAPPALPPAFTTTTLDPPVVVIGDPTVIIDPVAPGTVATPEPATVVTGLMGLLFAAGYVWWKGRRMAILPGMPN